jgi:hypothetical protein
LPSDAGAPPRRRHLICPAVTTSPHRFLPVAALFPRSHLRRGPRHAAPWLTRDAGFSRTKRPRICDMVTIGIFGFGGSFFVNCLSRSRTFDQRSGRAAESSCETTQRHPNFQGETRRASPLAYKRNQAWESIGPAAEAFGRCELYWSHLEIWVGDSSRWQSRLRKFLSSPE